MTTQKDTDDAPFSVSGIVNRAKKTLSGLGSFKVVGEVSGFKGPHAKSGHVYFQLKDENAAMDVIMWKGVFSSCSAPLRDGLLVEVVGKFDVYAASGKLSFIIQKLNVAGEGLLRQQVAELARKLEFEGLMDQSRKKPIAYFCEQICVITSFSGAVIDDVKRTLARRNPLVKIFFLGTAVQGEQAPAQIASALAFAQTLPVDAILLVRGGGSFEDLMTFNDERVARAIAASEVPVVTGIGHEPDTSIADMVADRRMSTPTAAAESIAPAKEDLFVYLASEKAKADKAFVGLLSRLDMSFVHNMQIARNAIVIKLERAQELVRYLAQSPVLKDPLYQLHMREDTLSQTAERLLFVGEKALPSKDTLINVRQRLVAAGRNIAGACRVRIAHDSGTLHHTADAMLVRPKTEICRLNNILDTLNPKGVLARGYAIIQKDGHALNGIQNMHVKDEIEVVMYDGQARATIDSIAPENRHV